MRGRLTALEKMLDSSMKREVKKSKGTWVVPFVLLVVVLVAVFFFIYVGEGGVREA